MSAVNTLDQALKTECIKRINEEGILRIKKCLKLLTYDQVWFKPNNNLNSVGNLCLHLIGNVNQWLISTLGNHPDHRIRESEFDPNNQFSIDELMERLSILAQNVEATMVKLSEKDLLKEYKVQCYNETGLSIIVHVIEHFSYHVGQITFYTKLILNVDLGYYPDEDLSQIN